MSPDPMEQLEIRAMQQRNELHDRANELKTKISETRERFDINRNVRRHFGAAAGIAAGVAFVAGYGIAGSFLNR